MPRAAGDSPCYRLVLLRNGEPDPSFVISVPSVTSILSALSKPDLERWKERLGPEESGRQRDEASERGTDAHFYLEALAGGELPEPKDGYQAAVLEWFFSREREVVACEEVVFHRSPLYMGTLDLIDGATLVDLKTAKRVYGETKLQLAAYKEAWHDMGRSRIERMMVVLARPNGTFEEHEVTDAEAPFDGFLHALDLYMANGAHR